MSQKREIQNFLTGVTTYHLHKKLYYFHHGDRGEMVFTEVNRFTWHCFKPCFPSFGTQTDTSTEKASSQTEVKISL
jgi:hypothetical protein